MDYKSHNSVFDFVLLENPTEDEFYKNLTGRYSADQIYVFPLWHTHPSVLSTGRCVPLLITLHSESGERIIL